MTTFSSGIPSKFTTVGEDRRPTDIFRLLTLAVDSFTGKKLYTPGRGMCLALNIAFDQCSLTMTEYLRCRSEVREFVGNVSYKAVYLKEVVDEETCLKIYRDWDNRYKYVRPPTSAHPDEGWPEEFF